jgi:uncharacterized protein YutE (UPF0331/DUF86 family)
MITSVIYKSVVTERFDWIERMLDQIRALPLDDRDAFFADKRNLATAESCLRRALEALCDLGRHMLAKGFARAVTEYKQIADELGAHQVLTTDETALLRTLAGYRNRLVHFYHEVSDDELYTICARQLPDVKTIADALRRWLQAHPEKMDETL